MIPAADNPTDDAEQSGDITLDGDDSVDESPGESAWAVSICFWSSLLVAAGIYGAVALAPKFAVWNTVRHEYRKNAERLSALEADVDYLERVTRALETDPEFVQRLAGVSGVAAADDGSEMIPVSGNLLFGYEDSIEHAAVSLPEKPPLDEVARTLATSSRLRNGLLMLSAFLTVFAFTFLNEAGEQLVQSTIRLLRAGFSYPMRRYTDATEEPGATEK